MFEFCTCNVICPCWMGEDADGDRCDVAVAWHFDKGSIDGVDVSGLTLGAIAHVPGNILDGGWRVSVVVDGNASAEQEEAILSVYTGKQGGPVADIVKLIGEVVSVERAPIIFEGDQGQGILKMGDAVDAEMVPYLNAKGEHTILQNSVFATIGGARAYVGKAPKYIVKNEALGMNVNLSGHNVVQGRFNFSA